ncbi:hypothetical protein [Methylosinus sp. H3A]|nr:hypothetical protein [Methylosinus sp. H3A]
MAKGFDRMHAAVCTGAVEARCTSRRLRSMTVMAPLEAKRETVG